MLHSLPKAGCSRKQLMQQIQWFDFDKWHAGQYKSLTFTGTRTGGAVAAAWAVMKYLGEKGYQDIARSVIDTRRAIAEGIRSIKGLQLIKAQPIFSTASTKLRERLLPLP